MTGGVHSRVGLPWQICLACLWLQNHPLQIKHGACHWLDLNAVIDEGAVLCRTTGSLVPGAFHW